MAPAMAFAARRADRLDPQGGTANSIHAAGMDSADPAGTRCPWNDHCRNHDANSSLDPSGAWHLGVYSHWMVFHGPKLERRVGSDGGNHCSVRRVVDRALP